VLDVDLNVVIEADLHLLSVIVIQLGTAPAQYVVSLLTLSSPVVSNGYTSECSWLYWSNPLFLIFNIRALWCSGLTTRVPECEKFKRGGLDQYGTEHFGRLIFATVRKSVGLKGLILTFTFFLFSLFNFCFVF